MGEYADITGYADITLDTPLDDAEIKAQILQASESDFVQEGELGSGEFGQVFKVKLGKIHMALKVVPITAASQMEINVWSSIPLHPNVAGLYAAVQTPDSFRMYMQLYPNGSMDKFLKNQTRADPDIKISPVKQVDIALQIASGLDHLHKHGVIHRDLAARNILLSNNYQAVVADFGLSRSTNDEGIYKMEHADTKLPRLWLSPEVIAKPGNFDTRADVWSFGTTLWEVVTLCRNPPYGMNDNPSFLINQLDDGPLVPLIRQCLSVDPAMRPTSSEICARLKELQIQIKKGITPLQIEGGSKPGVSGETCCQRFMDIFLCCYFPGTFALFLYTVVDEYQADVTHYPVQNVAWGYTYQDVLAPNVAWNYHGNDTLRVDPQPNAVSDCFIPKTHCLDIHKSSATCTEPPAIGLHQILCEVTVVSTVIPMMLHFFYVFLWAFGWCSSRSRCFSRLIELIVCLGTCGTIGLTFGLSLDGEYFQYTTGHYSYSIHGSRTGFFGVLMLSSVAVALYITSRRWFLQFFCGLCDGCYLLLNGCWNLSVGACMRKLCALCARCGEEK